MEGDGVKGIDDRDRIREHENWMKYPNYNISTNSILRNLMTISVFTFDFIILHSHLKKNSKFIEINLPRKNKNIKDIQLY